MHPGVAAFTDYLLVPNVFCLEVIEVVDHSLVEEVTGSYTEPQHLEAVGVFHEVREVFVHAFGGEVCAVGS